MRKDKEKEFYTATATTRRKHDDRAALKKRVEKLEKQVLLLIARANQR